jgi:hypothetical protein
MSKYDSLKLIAEEAHILENAIDMITADSMDFCSLDIFNGKTQVHFLSGLIGSDLELTKTDFEGETVHSKLSIEIDGVEFFELSAEPFLEEGEKI